MRSAFVGLVLLASPVLGQDKPAKPAEPPPARVVTVRALDSAQVGREFHQQLAKAREDKAPAVVLVAAPSLPWRADILRDALLELKESPLDIAVYLEGGQEAAHGRATWGAIALGIAAKHWGAADVLAVAVERDEEARTLGPEKTNWTAIEGDLRDLLAPRVQARGWIDGAVDVLFWPTEVWWSTATSKGGAPFTLSKGAEPAKEEGRTATPLNREGGAGAAARFQVGLLRLTGEAGQGPRRAASWEAFCKAEKIKAPAQPTEATGPSLSEVRSGLEQTLEQDAALSRQIDSALDAAEAKNVSAAEAARVGMRELSRLNGLDSMLTAVENLLERYPELLKTTPPGKVTVGAKPASNASRWRSVLQSRRDAAAKLKDRARKLQERKP